MRIVNKIRQRVGLAVILVVPGIAAAQSPSDWHSDTVKKKTKAKVESVTVVAGKQFARGAAYRRIFGDNYRDLWTTPIRVPVLDLHTKGLHPTKEGGGNQTKNVRLEDEAGREYVFRLTEKSVNSAPRDIRGTPIATVVNDEVSAQHPAGAVMSAPLVDAVGILHPTPHLMLMADDSALGKVRGDFGGKLGMLEEYPNVPKDAKEGFGGASKIIDSEELKKLLDTDAEEHVDGPAFLAARLVDFVLNDNDRHGGNWKWARIKGESKDQWEPIARDRDHAFLSFQGIVMSVAHFFSPVVVKFDGEPNVPGLTQPRGFDARMLVGVEKPVFDSVAKAVQGRLTDSVIDVAVHTMPVEYQKTAPKIAAILKQRRAAIPKAADAFYKMLAERVAIHATDSADRATIVRRDDGRVDVRLDSKGKAYFARRFDPRETVELLVYLHGGSDTAVVKGAAKKSILVRVIGGNGTNTLLDSSTVGGHAHPTRLYDQGKVSGISYGADTAYDRRPWEKLGDTLVPHLPDDGGGISPVVGISEHRSIGVTPRLGIKRYSYGFSKRPYASMIGVDAEYATEFHAGRVSVEADKRLESSPLHFSAFGRTSDFESVAYHGLGNATPDSGPSRYYEVRQRQWLFRPTAGWAVGQSLDFSFGPMIQHSSTADIANRFVSTTKTYGAGSFNEAGLRAGMHYEVESPPDTMETEHTHHRILMDASAEYVPAMMDVSSAFEAADLTVGTSTTLPVVTHPLLVVRAGGRKVFGNAPFFEAATLGGESTMRYLDTERYAGDAALYATTELRVPLAQFTLLMPLRAGILGLAEAGRVYVDGESPGGWHSRAGGGVWIGLRDASPVLTLTRTNEPGRPGVGLRLGLNF
jgi:hypothetical protein